MEAVAGPSAAVKGRAGKRRWPWARLTCRASPRPVQVLAHCRPISAPGRQQVCPPGSHRPGGRQRRDAGAGGRQAPHTFLPPPRPARPPRPPAAAGAQLEQKPGRKASAGAAVERASPQPGESGLHRLAGREGSARSLPALSALPQRRPQQWPPAPGAEVPVDRGPESGPAPLSPWQRRRGLLCLSLSESLPVCPQPHPEAGGRRTGRARVTLTHTLGETGCWEEGPSCRGGAGLGAEDMAPPGMPRFWSPWAKGRKTAHWGLEGSGGHGRRVGRNRASGQFGEVTRGHSRWTVP